jgi:hypothetical protein
LRTLGNLCGQRVLLSKLKHVHFRDSTAASENWLTMKPIDDVQMKLTGMP